MICYRDHEIPKMASQGGRRLLADLLFLFSSLISELVIISSLGLKESISDSSGIPHVDRAVQV